MFSTKFISATKEYTTIEKGVPAPYIRKTFNVEDFTSAEVYVCGLGFYEFYVNGEKITKGKFAPYISNPDHVCYYDKYDLTNLLKKGKNAFGFILGNGFLNNPGGVGWDFDKAEYRSAPKLAIALIIDGKVVMQADKSFKWAPSPIIFDDYRIGEHYDAKLEIKGWNLPDFDDRKWKKCIKAKTPKGEKKLCTANPIKCVEEIKPVKIWRVECGNLYDFGVNRAGVVRFNLKNKYAPHQRFLLHHGEVLVENRMLYKKNLAVPFRFNLDNFQTDVYWTKDDGTPEVYEPHFTYHGFRYVFVEGIDNAQATEDLLTMLVYHTDFEDESEFSCDDQRVNAIQKMTMNANKGNFHYFPTDCPQREKNGWLGDAGLSAEQFYYNFGCKKDLREWFTSIRKAQGENGAVPGIVPTAGWGLAWGNGPLEDHAIVEIPYYDYKTHGDIEFLQENAQMIRNYFEYVEREKTLDDGLYEFGLLDWCEQRWEGLEKDVTPLEITDSLLVIDMLEKGAFIFNVLGDDYATVLKIRADRIRKTFREKYIDENLFVPCRKQTAQARAIAQGIFTKEELPKAVQNLIEIIKEDGDRTQVGVIGGRVIFDVLAQNGYHDLALKLIEQSKYPSYGYWVDKGYDTLLENFYETVDNSIFRKDGMLVQSFNHHFWGFVSGFFYKYIAGLKINVDGKDANNLVISPLVFKGINHVDCTFNKDGKRLKYTVDVIDNKPQVTVLENVGFNVEIK